MFLRRLGQQNKQQCVQGYYCPQVLEMRNGDFAVVGADIRAEAVKEMPPGLGVGPNEGVVQVPRQVMLSAMADFFAAAA